MAAAAAVLAVGGTAVAQPSTLPGVGAPPTSQYPVVNPQPVPPSDLSVLDRPVPGYEPIGLPWGSFYVFPRVDLAATYDTNVYATPNDDKGAEYFDIRPGVYVVSNWPRNAVDLEADVDEQVYTSQTANTNTNAHVEMNGRYDIVNNVYIASGAGYTLAHEDRASPSTIANQKNPIEYQVGTVWLRYVHEAGLIGFRVTGQLFAYNYNNGTATAPGTPSPISNLPCLNGTIGTTVCETYRDHNEYWITPQVSYELYPGYYAFIQAPINWREYYEHNDIFGYDRSSWGYEVDAGLAVALTGKTFGRVYIGYLDQMYDDPRLAAAQGVSFGGDLLWNVTPITSVKLAASRTVQETEPTTVPGAPVPASSILQSAGSAAVEHALRQNLFLWGRIGVTGDQFVGTNRDDTIFWAQTGIRYLINRFVNVGADFSYDERSSNYSEFNYSRELIAVRLRVQE